ncbi:MAG: OmpA family protein [Phaeodactylibacter sp.]|nr:OmpA family protein [Phaeodactylibacter sp.]
MKRNSFALLPLFIATFIACVPTKKYQDLETERNQFKEEAEALGSIGEENTILKEELTTCKADLKASILENEELLIINNQLQKDNADLSARFERLLQQNNALLSSASYEKQSLMEQLAAQQAELDRKLLELQNTSTNIDERQGMLQQLQQEIIDREQRIAELESLVNSQSQQMAQLKSSINQALLGFSDADFNVEEKNGRLYVTLSQNLLFRSGSSKLDVNGRQAIQQLAQALVNKSDIAITVEGHTDSDGTADRNWDLSTARALAVVKILAEFGVPSERLTASGRAFYAPLVANDSPEHKAMNRRTEIILSPKLDDLYSILGN